MEEQKALPAGQAKVDKIVEFFLMTPEARYAFITELAARVHDGYVPAIKAAVAFKNMAEIGTSFTSTDSKENPVFKDMAKEFKKAMLEEAEKFGAKNFEHLGCKMRIGEVGSTFSFTMCGDPVYPKLEQQKKKAADALKERTEFLKTVPVKGQEIIVGDEAVTVYPPSKTSTTALIISLK